MCKYKNNLLYRLEKYHELTTNTFGLSQEEYNAIEQEKKHYCDARSVSIQALKIVQKNRGWISDNSIESISKILNISNSDVEGVATFYSQIFRQPVGRHIIKYCDSIVCYITGYQKIVKKIEQLLDIKPGETTKDNRFTLIPTCCLGNCDKGPTMMVDEDTYTYLTQKNIKILLEKYK